MEGYSDTALTIEEFMHEQGLDKKTMTVYELIDALIQADEDEY